MPLQNGVEGCGKKRLPRLKSLVCPISLHNPAIFGEKELHHFSLEFPSNETGGCSDTIESLSDDAFFGAGNQSLEPGTGWDGSELACY
jgi:hypothetical protein